MSAATPAHGTPAHGTRGHDRRPVRGLDQLDQDEFQRRRPSLQALAYQRVGSAEEAEDIISEAWLRWTTARDVQNVENHGAFLATVVSHLCADYWKSAHTRRVSYVGTLVPEENLAPATTAEEPLQTVERTDELRRGVAWLLELLGPAERAVLVLRLAFEYSYREIAAVLGISEVYCRKLYGRAHDRLAEGRPRFTAARVEQTELTQRLLAASRAGELRPLETLLAAGLAS
ncbi:sigma-70 family RNA polymerase sigma factor [Streptomyces sp. LP05-1]|uniref:Sigma-70 family RNA polymerase sigma factor n=1 Tax=Streptomyces pyxinae TaxID=2970734 RepID=A0ABT2CQD9_9ACTN|nr:sigma-70 family RNA polymerase sigma factor [Streptomyces sp. LP05-1]MCS0639655.1 sigma-70 family RNA polymerase sigma factor [Streptomyces sp. LP05-1]